MNKPAAIVRGGCLYVVATPIGNLDDLSPRAAAVLGAVDVVAAEDTRTTGHLLTLRGVQAKRLVALHDHNEDKATAGLIKDLQAEKSVALVSDAGTPLLSDPGYRLVIGAREAGVTVLAVPGPSAITAALSVAGLPTDSFTFAGFLPPKTGARKKRLAELAREPRTVVVFESPHRIIDAVRDAAEVLGPDRRIALAREISKKFEQSHVAPAPELLAWLEADPDRQRGEFVLLFEENSASDEGANMDADALLRALVPELGAAKAAKVVAGLTGVPRNRLYEQAKDVTEG